MESSNAYGALFPDFDPILVRPVEAVVKVELIRLGAVIQVSSIEREG